MPKVPSALPSFCTGFYLPHQQNLRKIEGIYHVSYPLPPLASCIPPQLSESQRPENYNLHIGLHNCQLCNKKQISK